MSDEDDKIIGMYELLDALEAVIKAADPAKREALAETIDAYHEDFPEDFHWAVGAQAPTLLSNLMNVALASNRNLAVSSGLLTASQKEMPDDDS